MAGVQGFDLVGRTDHLPHLDVVVQKRNELAPSVAPQSNCRRIALSPFGFERIKCRRGGLGVDRGVDRLEGLGDRITTLTPGVTECPGNQVDDTLPHDGVGERRPWPVPDTESTRVLESGWL